MSLDPIWAHTLAFAVKPEKLEVHAILNITVFQLEGR